jgi:hypothetical protein
MFGLYHPQLGRRDRLEFRSRHKLTSYPAPTPYRMWTPKHHMAAYTVLQGGPQTRLGRPVVRIVSHFFRILYIS